MRFEIWIMFIDYEFFFLLLALAYFSLNFTVRENLLVDHPWYIYERILNEPVGSSIFF